MKVLLAAALTVVSATFVAAGDSGAKTFKGVITDSQCATNVHSVSHSHKEMLAQGTMGKTEADCVRTCVEQWGGEYVLLTRDNRVWHLSDQKAAAKLAARSVTVTGYPSADDKTIQMTSISVK